MVAGGTPLAGADGKRVGDYDPFVELHKGHYGSLWAATGSAGEVVAIRVVSPGMPLRSDDEALILDGMVPMKGKEIDGSVPLLDVLQADGALALVSSYVEGYALHHLLRQSTARTAPLSLPIALRLASDLLTAVSALQQDADYLPGGLTSDCILLGVDGRTRILEPSAGAAAGRVSAFANHRDHIGYRAPEQLLEQPEAATAASDVFSLGALIWELLRNGRLFKGFAASQIRRAITGHKPEPLTETASGALLPALVGELVQRALQPDPTGRFRDAADMLLALDAVSSPLASHEEVAALLQTLVGKSRRMKQIRDAVKAHGGASAIVSAQAPGSTAPSKIGKPAAPSTAAAPEVPTDPAPAPATAPAVPKLAPPRAPLPTSPREQDSPVPASAAPALDAVDVEPAELAPADAEPSSERHSAPPSEESLPPPDSSRFVNIELPDPDAQRQIGRCELFAEIARGGMATIHLGRWLGAGGFAKTVAVKALYPQYARDPDFVKMFLDEARVVARIRHPNVMPTLDLVEEQGELFIIMDYVHGVTLTYLTRKAHQLKKKIPLGVTLRIALGMLNGLHAAHEATNERGESMCVIHRDVSPENVLIGIDGFPRLIDFGIASALGNLSSTREGQVKGKFAYLAPEQVLGDPLTRRTDVYSASVVLWQVLTGKRLFKGDNLAEMTYKILHGAQRKPSELVPKLPAALDAIVMKGLALKAKNRWDSAEEMAEAIEGLGLLAPQREVARFVRDIAQKRLDRVARLVEAVESAPLNDSSEIIDGAMTVRPAARNSIPAGAELAALAAWGAGEDDDISLHADISQSGTDITSETDAVLAEATGRTGTSPTRMVVAGGVLALAAAISITALLLGGRKPKPAAPPPATSQPSAPATAATAAPTATASATAEPSAKTPGEEPDAGGPEQVDAGSSSPAADAGRPWPSTKGKTPWPSTTTTRTKTKVNLPSDI